MKVNGRYFESETKLIPSQDGQWKSSFLRHFFKKTYIQTDTHPNEALTTYFPNNSKTIWNFETSI